jgi:hypothetical protein
LALRTLTSEDGVVIVNREASLLLGDVSREECHRHVGIEQQPTVDALDVIVPVDALIEPARLIRKRQLLNHVVVGQDVQRPVDGPISQLRVLPPDTLEDLARGQVAFGRLDLAQDHRALCRVAVGSGHVVTSHSDRSIVANESRYR